MSDQDTALPTGGLVGHDQRSDPGGVITGNLGPPPGIAAKGYAPDERAKYATREKRRAKKSTTGFWLAFAAVVIVVLIAAARGVFTALPL